MGHVRLGQLPRTRKWRDVVELIAAGADVPQVANATIKAAESAYSFVNDDCGYNQAVWLLTQLGLAGGKENPLEYLRSQGVEIPDNTSLPGIAVALTEALDNHSSAHGGHSDLGELAQRALVDAVIQRMEPKLQQQSLFNMEAYDTQRALSECMNYFLSQTLATNLGEGQRFPTMNQMAQFETALATHCREASVIVEKFSGEWFSKHRYEEQNTISRESVKGFASWALKKMKDELKAGAVSDG